jgi:hypothetical protein
VNFTLELLPNHTTASEIKGSTHKMDAFLRPSDRSKHVVVDGTPVLTDTSGTVRFRTSEVAVPFEFKRTTEPKLVKDVGGYPFHLRYSP